MKLKDSRYAKNGSSKFLRNVKSFYQYNTSLQSRIRYSDRHDNLSQNFLILFCLELIVFVVVIAVSALIHVRLQYRNISSVAVVSPSPT
jgi:hypothetical protein